MHSSHKFSLEPVLDVAVELIEADSKVAPGAAKLETTPKGPESMEILQQAKTLSGFQIAGN